MTQQPPARGARAAIVYLGAPAVLFLLLFTKLSIGMPVLALLLTAAWFAWRGAPSERGAWLPAAAGALAVALIAGFPAGPYSWDWVKHWALLGELSERPWPLVMDLNGESHFLRYYVGAYLVPALFHSLIPQIPLWVSVASWFALGFGLVLRMVVALAPSPVWRWLTLLLVLALGGADVFGQYGYRLLFDYPTPVAPVLGLHHESWIYNIHALPLEYSSVVTAFAWVPHQAIAAFLVAALLAAPPAQRSFPLVLLGYGLLALWSPYAVIGLLPLVLVAAIQHRAQTLEPRTLVAAAGGASFALLVAWYLATDLPTGGSCFGCFPERLGQFAGLLPFLAVELIPFALMLGHRMWSDVMCRAAAATLIVIPLMHGEAGDFVMRASLGPLFVLGYAAIGAFISDWAAARRRLVHAIALALCAPTAISEVVYLRTAGEAHFAFESWDPLRAPWMTDFARSDRFTAQEFFDRCGWKYMPQYFTPRQPSMLQSVGTGPPQAP